MNSKRPYIICHRASSVDGKIDGSALRSVMRSGEYEALHSSHTAVPLNLKSVEPRESGALWIRYEVLRASA
jgi:hypothetical protein